MSATSVCRGAIWWLLRR